MKFTILLALLPLLASAAPTEPQAQQLGPAITTPHALTSEPLGLGTQIEFGSNHNLNQYEKRAIKETYYVDLFDKNYMWVLTEDTATGKSTWTHRAMLTSGGPSYSSAAPKSSSAVVSKASSSAAKPSSAAASASISVSKAASSSAVRSSASVSASKAAVVSVSAAASVSKAASSSAVRSSAVSVSKASSSAAKSSAVSVSASKPASSSAAKSSVASSSAARSSTASVSKAVVSSSSKAPIASSTSKAPAASSTSKAPVVSSTSKAAALSTTVTSVKPSTSSSSAAASASASAAAGVSAADQAQFVTLHNNFRARYSAGQVTWDDSLAAFALKTAQTCKYGHTGGPYGENIAAGVGGGYNIDKAFSSWANEDALYNFSSPGYSSATGHFTQIVWKGTSKIGCAAASCADGTIFTGYRANSTYVVCEYQTPGNVVSSNPDRTAELFRTNVGPKVA